MICRIKKTKLEIKSHRGTTDNFVLLVKNKNREQTFASGLMSATRK